MDEGLLLFVQQTMKSPTTQDVFQWGGDVAEFRNYYRRVQTSFRLRRVVPVSSPPTEIMKAEARHNYTVTYTPHVRALRDTREGRSSRRAVGGIWKSADGGRGSFARFAF